MCNNDCCTNHTCHAFMIFSILALLLWPNTSNINILNPKNNTSKPQTSINNNPNNNSNNNNNSTMIKGFSYGVLFTLLVLIFVLNNFTSSPKYTIESTQSSSPTWRPRSSSMTVTGLDTGQIQEDSGGSDGGGGIERDLLRTFPSFAYSKRRPHRMMGRGVSVCAICQSKFRDNEMLRWLPDCDHLFHLDCIDEWLSFHNTCPCCRSDLIWSF